MENKKGLKLFISYSHKDNKGNNKYVEDFRKHLTPLKDNGLLEEWYDRKILPGQDWREKINNNLEDADIVCLFVSANFLASGNCQEEKRKALELRKKKGIYVVPIIISECLWKEDKEISKLLALPTDGKPISTFSNVDSAWVDVCERLKSIIEEVLQIKHLEIRKDFKKFLQDVEILSKLHPKKGTVFLRDIFIPPDLEIFDEMGEYDKRINFNDLLNNFPDYSKIAIAGENQAGKTTICKVLFAELKKRGFIPIYIPCSTQQGLSGKIENRISQFFNEQYDKSDIDLNKIEPERIVPIIDDFHLVKQKEKHIKDLSKYPHCVLTADDIFVLNIKDIGLILPFRYFKISEFKPSLRYELIKKWKSLDDMEGEGIDLYKDIDETTELINSTLGKIWGKGIMPAYPFFILSAIVTYETFAMPLNQEITSQGYCYQALIYFHLTKQGVKNDEMDIYINFLTELSYYFYKKRQQQLSISDFEEFMKYYTEKFAFPIRKEVLLRNLNQIVGVDSFNSYSFRYLYIYYFFVAKYLAEHMDDKDVSENIEYIMQNLHVDENAYIAIFLIHHTKHLSILDEIELNVMCLFDKYAPASLAKDEVSFFDEQAQIIIDASLPSFHTTPEKERHTMLKIEDHIEGQKESEKNMDVEDDLVRNLRRAIKTAEVVGCILKNRVGSLEKNKLEELFEEAMNVHLRILSSFFEMIKDKDAQKRIIDYISEKLNKVSEERERKLSKDEMKEISRTTFWNLNFLIVYGIINKIVHSLGSDKLKDVAEDVCDKVNTPASLLVKHGIFMWYLKHLQIDEIAKMMKRKDFSRVAERITKFMVAAHCHLHPINYKDRQKIESKLSISRRSIPIYGHKDGECSRR